MKVFGISLLDMLEPVELAKHNYKKTLVDSNSSLQVFWVLNHRDAVSNTKELPSLLRTPLKTVCFEAANKIEHISITVTYFLAGTMEYSPQRVSKYPVH